MMKGKWKDFVNACDMRATVSTTGYCGGDSGHGGVTTFTIQDIASSDLNVAFLNEDGKRVEMESSRVEIILKGDAELENLRRIFSWAATALDDLVVDHFDY